MRMHRRKSDSSLYCKVRGGEELEESTSKTENQDQDPHGQEEEGSRDLYQKGLAFVQTYLEKDFDARSMRTETSDSGMPRTHRAPSESGSEEISGN